MRSAIESVNLSLTTFCNMRCPDCCCNITHLAKEEKSFFSWEYFVEAARWLRGIDRVHVTGGEPSMHPQFEELIPKFRELFGCRLLTTETNGLGFRKKLETFAHFDTVYCSHYTAKVFDGSPDNTADIAMAKTRFAVSPEIIVGEVVHQPRIKRGKRMCARGEAPAVAYCDGLIFPCCVGPGLTHTDRVAMTPRETWRQDILNLHPPCDGCFFALD